MEELFSRSWGWSSAEIRRELNHNEARFLLLRERQAEADEGPPVAFAHIRFEDEEGVPSLYIYELQLEPRMHRRGIGTALMCIAECVGEALGMRQSVLTVLKINQPAHRFYTKGLGYGIDWTSPDRDPSSGCPYFILSKSLESRPSDIEAEEVKPGKQAS
jgi:ribosomal protein S18 acetylase RimI-like enzyme